MAVSIIVSGKQAGPRGGNQETYDHPHVAEKPLHVRAESKPVWAGTEVPEIASLTCLCVMTHSTFTHVDRGGSSSNSSMVEGRKSPA